MYLVHSEHPPYRIVSEVVVNFPNNLDEVTLIAEPECVRLKNYVEDDGEFYGSTCTCDSVSCWYILLRAGVVLHM